MRSTYLDLMSVVKNTLKQHDCFFHVVDGCTLHLDSYLNMPPVLSIKSSGVDFSCPLASYETDEQSSAILQLCKNHRELWYDELRWSAYIRECNNHEAGVSRLPDGLAFTNSRANKRIYASLSYDRNTIIANPEALYSGVSVVLSYRDALMDKLYSVLYYAMPKTLSDPKDPRALLYSSIFLYHKNGANSIFSIDFNDVKSFFRDSKQLVFYPRLKATSFEDLVFQMNESISEEIVPSESFGLLMSVTVPYQTLMCRFPYGALREQFNTDQVHINLLCNNDSTHSYESEMVFLRLEKRK